MESQSHEVSEVGAMPLDAESRLADKLDAAMLKLSSAKPFAKSLYQNDVFQIAEALMASDEGMLELFGRAPDYESAGVFFGGPWQDPIKLQANLVAGSLKAGGVYPIVEIMSELRMLAIAKGLTPSTVSPEQATEFLNEVLALNLEFIFPTDSEEERISGGPHWQSACRLFRLLADNLDLSGLRKDVLEEIEQICAQRPILTARVRKMIELAGRIPVEESNENGEMEAAPQGWKRIFSGQNSNRAKANKELKNGEMAESNLSKYINAIHGASTLSLKFQDIMDYRSAIKKADEQAIELEAKTFSKTLSETGLTSPHHAVLVRHLAKKNPSLIPEALCLNNSGTATFEEYKDFTLQLIKASLFPGTSSCIYGLGKMLNAGLFSRQEVISGLDRLVTLDIKMDVKQSLLNIHEFEDGATPNAILLAGVITVFGQPLGVGQGANPTCQAARGISLWAQHAHGYLLNLIISAARDGLIEIPFEGQVLDSSKLEPGLTDKLALDLDPVSTVLVPHLDRIYGEMMRRVVLRNEDGHKWVNPGLYGRWVPHGFSSVFTDLRQTIVGDYANFIRRFYATHHPNFNDGHSLMYPNPVGILITNSQGDYLGAHAVSLQRVEESPQGELRAYFYNPNNEGRQNWGAGINPVVQGNGEKEGESSLKFEDFAARLYAFHYNPYEEGDAYAVPLKTIKSIHEAAKNSWGKNFTWLS